jgi:hypothetical protein
VATIPDFITHYHLPDRQPFLNLSDLDDDELRSALSSLQAASERGASQRRFGSRYMQLRRATEELLRSRFIERGGTPTRRSPHYFVLGESAWFRGLYRDANAVRLLWEPLPTEQVSITYPDSVTSMGLLAAYGIAVAPRDYHGKVFRIEELADLVARYGLLEAGPPDSYEGHQFRDFEHYVEVQVWDDEALRAGIG